MRKYIISSIHFGDKDFNLKLNVEDLNNYQGDAKFVSVIFRPRSPQDIYRVKYIFYETDQKLLLS